MTSLTSYAKRHVGDGSLASLLSKYISDGEFTRGKRKLPLDDQSCARQIKEAMNVYFSKRNIPYTSNADLQHPFIDFVRKDASSASLREEFYIFLTLEEKQLPGDNVECRRVIEKGLDIFFEKVFREIPFTPSAPIIYFD